jgi:hypothetical protein
MKKLLLLLPLILFFGCNDITEKMDYKVTYITASYEPEVDLPLIWVKMDVVEKLAPNIYIVETSFKCKEEVDINAISLVINYEPDAITFLDKKEINGKLWINEYDNIDSLGITLYNNTGKDIRYSFATLQETICKDEFIFRNIVEVHAPTEIEFSSKQGDLEFMAMSGKIYPLKYTYLKFER